MLEDARSGAGAAATHMSATASTKIALAVASGYLLGRTKKLRLAFTVGSLLAGQRIATNPQALLAQASKIVDSNPQLQDLQKQVSGKLFEAVREAAILTAASRVEQVTKALQAGPAGRAEEILGDALGEETESEAEDEGAEESAQPETEEPQAEEPVAEEPVAEEPEEEEPEEEEPEAEEPEPAKKAAAKKTASGGAAKKTAAKKTAAGKKTASKKASATKAAAKKATGGRTSKKATSGARR